MTAARAAGVLPAGGPNSVALHDMQASRGYGLLLHIPQAICSQLTSCCLSPCMPASSQELSASLQ